MPRRPKVHPLLRPTKAVQPDWDAMTDAETSDYVQARLNAPEPARRTPTRTNGHGDPGRGYDWQQR